MRGARAPGMSAGAIPGEFAGASLKLGIRLPRPTGAEAHPRRIRRGLIEARTTLRTDNREASERAAIPGEFAGASLKLCATAAVADGSDSMPIPGEFAGASLKHQLRQAASTTAAVPIPGEFAGASLKRCGYRRPRLAESDAHPRRIRRGLIEATLPRRPAVAAYPSSIPGEFAGASLKLPIINDETAIPGEFAGASLKLHSSPHATSIAGRIRRGLIEAVRRIPGEFAGASLKHRRLSRRPRAIPFAGASAKKVSLGHAPRPGHPRRIRRGLIEATPGPR